MVTRPRFEILFYLYLYLDASILAALAGRPWLGALGLVTVVPFAALWLRAARSGEGPLRRPGEGS